MYQLPTISHGCLGLKITVLAGGTVGGLPSGFGIPGRCSYLVKVSLPIIVDFHLSIHVSTLDLSNQDVSSCSWPSSHTTHWPVHVVVEEPLRQITANAKVTLGVLYGEDPEIIVQISFIL